jgi:hypothetical protein
MPKSTLLLAILLATAGCGAPTAPNDRDGLAAARERWRIQGSATYSYEINRSCFCVFGGRRMTVTVQSGSVSGADYLDSGTAVEAALLTYVPTIPDLFDLIEAALEQRAAYFFARYDSEYGYPTKIDIDYSVNAIDDELAISARSLVVTALRSR